MTDSEKRRTAFIDEKKNHVAHARAILAGIVLLSIFLRALWIQTPVVRDEGAAGYIAMVWSRGLSPYSYPMASVNPPLAYLLYLIPSQLFGNTIIPARLLNDALYTISIVFLYLTGKNWFGKKVGLVSAFFFGIFMNAPIFETQLAIPASLSIPFIVASVYLLDVFLRRNRNLALVASGMLMSAATLILQYQAVGVIMLLVILIYSRYQTLKQRRESRGSFLTDLARSALVLAIGVAIPILVAVLYFWSNGAFVGLIQSTILRFLGPGYVSQPDVYSSIKFLIMAEALPLWLFSIAGFAWCIFRIKKQYVFLIIWTILFLTLIIPPPHFGRHFSQLIPPASLLSGVAIVSILGETELKFTLKSLRRKRAMLINEKKAIGLFFIMLLLASFIPVIYFQPVQYPNTNFSLYGETMYYTFSTNWTEQQETIEYIKSQTMNGAIFIHGWEAELYWLSGNLAPDIRWASSYRSAAGDITDEEYGKILSLVKAGNFGTVILMSGFPPDEIMLSVPERYFFVKDIGLYSIYSKYNSEGYSIEYNFAENLGQALQKYSLEDGTGGNLSELNESFYLPAVQELAINGDSRSAIEQIPINPWDSHSVISELIYTNVSISPGSKLSFGTGMDPAVWNKDTDGVVFKIQIQDDKGIHEVFSSYVNPSKNPADRRWQDYSLNMDEFSGKSIAIYFVTTPGPNRTNAWDWAYWSNPLVLEGR